jgi:hypothetical protein
VNRGLKEESCAHCEKKCQSEKKAAVAEEDHPLLVIQESRTLRKAVHIVRRNVKKVRKAAVPAEE